MRDCRPLLLHTLFLPHCSPPFPEQTLLPWQLQEVLWEMAGGLSPLAPEGRMLCLGGTARCLEWGQEGQAVATCPERLRMTVTDPMLQAGGGWG